MISRRGVHLQPAGYHGAWLSHAGEWIYRLRSMGIEVVVLCSDGDGGLGAAEVLASHGIQPVIRFTPSNLPRPFPHMTHVERFVAICEHHNMEAIVQAGNEPSDSREWKDGDVPRDWLAQFAAWWCNAASIIVQRGGIAGFPDGPCYAEDPFPYITGTWPWWEAGRCIYLGHFYGLNRPPDYPYNAVARQGKQLTAAEHRAALGSFYDLPGWREDLAAINAQRAAWANPHVTALEDSTCWRGWEPVAAWMQGHFGKTLRMALSEGGWTPGAQAGDDIRWPKPTPDAVATWTLSALEEDVPLEFQCFWLLADALMGGAGAWEQDAWVSGWASAQGYGLEKPVVQALQKAARDPVAVIRDELVDVLAKLRRALEIASPRR